MGFFIESLFAVQGRKMVSAVSVGILMGIIIRNLMGIPKAMEPGIDFALRRLLRCGIVLLGLGFSLLTVIQIGFTSILLVILVVLTAMLTSKWLGSALGLPSNLATLIGVGTAICGNSAIVATAPVIGADESEVSLAAGTITLFGVLAVFIYPIIGSALALTESQFGVVAGLAVHDSAQSIATGFIYGNKAGGIATIVKLTRTAFIVPVILFLAIQQTRHRQAETKISYVRLFPWFAMGFLMMAAVRTLGDYMWSNSIMWGHVLKNSRTVANMFIVSAMVSVGLRTDLSQFRRVGLKAVLTGLLTWGLVGGLTFWVVFSLF